MIDIDCIDQSVEIDDTLVSFIDLSWFLPISSIRIGKNSCWSVHQKIKTEFMQKKKFIDSWEAIDSQKIIHLLLYCLSNIITYKEIFKKILSFL